MESLNNDSVREKILHLRASSQVNNLFTYTLVLRTTLLFHS